MVPRSSPHISLPDLQVSRTKSFLFLRSSNLWRSGFPQTAQYAKPTYLFLTGLIYWLLTILCCAWTVSKTSLSIIASNLSSNLCKSSSLVTVFFLDLNLDWVLPLVRVPI